MHKPEDIIKFAVGRYGEKCALACSFGMASTAVLRMCLDADPNIPVVFENTKCQPIETLRYRDKIVSEWNVNLIETEPYQGHTFWTLVDKYGLPKGRKSGGKGSNAPRCCWYLKEKPAELKYKEMGTLAVITGLMAVENRNRKLLAMRYDNHYRKHDDIEMCAQRYYAKTQGMWKIHPIMHWTQEDLKGYYSANGLPVNEFYTKWCGLYPRSGCLPCTAYSSWKDRLSISHPKLFAKLVELEESGPSVGQGNGPKKEAAEAQDSTHNSREPKPQ